MRLSRIGLAAGLVMVCVGAQASVASAFSTLAPTSHDFGAQQVGTSGSPASFTLTTLCVGPGCQATSSPTVSVSAGFVQTNDCPATLTATNQNPASCTINVRFAPSTISAYTGALNTGTLTFGGSEVAATLTGSGVPAPGAQPSPTPTGQRAAALAKCKKKKSKKARRKCRARAMTLPV